MNRLFFVLCLALCLLTWAQLYSLNQISIIQTLTDNFNGGCFGLYLVSMDFNGDGYDDLIVRAPEWHPSGVFVQDANFGKLYFYWGGPELDNVPDFEIEGQYPYNFGIDLVGAMCNAGDMNGDGIDDLVVDRRLSENFTHATSIYFGSEVPSSTPDIEFVFPDCVYSSVYALGDINGDGLGDISISHRTGSTELYHSSILTDIASGPYELCSNNVSYAKLNGIGDVNNDGFDDCLLTNTISNMVFYDKRIVIYYGGSSFPVCDSLVISDHMVIHKESACSIGDMNNDGYGDFFGYDNKVWMCSANLSSTPNLEIIYNNAYNTWDKFGSGDGKPGVYGDFNGDGYDDLICTSFEANSTYDGQAGLWLGGANVNGTMDLRMYHPIYYSYRNFGFAKAAGDYNGDGLCDVAISAPYWGTGGSFLDPGNVFIFAGNTELADTTVANEDELSPPLNLTDWQIGVYPNPCAKVNSTVNIELIGDSYQKHADISYELYNIKGQKLQSKSITTANFEHKTILVDTADLSSGVYIIAISNKGTIVNAKRIALY